MAAKKTTRRVLPKAEKAGDMLIIRDRTKIRQPTAQQIQAMKQAEFQRKKNTI